MSGKSSRRRGHGFERLVATILRTIGAPDAERNLEYQRGKQGHDVHYRREGSNGSYQVLVSCKYGNQVPASVYAWLLQTVQPTSPFAGDITIGDETYRVCRAQYEHGNAWITKAIGGCDELWCKRPGWPIVVVYRANRDGRM